MKDKNGKWRSSASKNKFKREGTKLPTLRFYFIFK
jgi:hypothetical protein